MSKLQQAIDTINFDEKNEVGGEYGLHDGFFNALVKIDGIVYHFQGCASDDLFNSSDCGHDDGICGDVNEKLAKKLAEDNELYEGYKHIQLLLEKAYELWK